MVSNAKKCRHCSRRKSYRVAREAIGPGEAIPFERREEIRTTGQTEGTQLSLSEGSSVPKVGWGENQTKFDTTLKEILNSYLYNTTPSAKATSIK